MWEKFIHQLEAHPYLFGGVALGVVVLMFWGGSSGSSGTSAISAAESQAIANSAQANASLQLANDQVQMNAQNANAAVSINGQNTATAQAIAESTNAASVQAAQIAAGANAYNADSQVKLAGIQAGMQHDLENSILSSQTSSQDWITNLEENVKKYQLPSTLSTAGLDAMFSPQTAPATTFRPFGGFTTFLNHESNGTEGAEGANSNGGGDGNGM